MKCFILIPSQAFGALQNKVATHQRKVNSLPAAMPAIDFDSYRAKVCIVVINFLSKYLFDFQSRSLWPAWLTTLLPSTPPLTFPTLQTRFEDGDFNFRSLIVFNVLFFQGTLAAIDAQAAEQKAAVAKFTAESNARIEGIKVLP